MKIKLLSLILFCFSFKSFASYLDYIYTDRTPSLNSWGQVGLIQTPTADTYGESSAFLSITQNDIYKFGSINVSPFDWLEASYFYYRPNDLYWDFVSPATKGKYLDKGFSLKMLRKSESFPNLAIGLNDFAGTGVFTGEYIAITEKFSNFNLTLGIGWGKFAGENSFEHPIKRFSDRPKISGNYDQGGTLSYDKWFRGPNSLFGGIEYFIPRANGLKFKLELDPFDYYDFACCGGGISEDFKISRDKDNNFNFGISYPINKNLSINISYIKGNLINLSWSIGGSFYKSLVKKEKFKPDVIKEDPANNNFYEALLENLNKNQLYLQSAEIDDNDLKVAISTSKYRSSIRAARYAIDISEELVSHYQIPLGFIEVTRINGDIELNKIKRKIINDPRKEKSNEYVFSQTKFNSGNKDEYNNNAFVPRVLFPISSTDIYPGIVNHIGSPEKFYLGSLVLNVANETLFSRRLILSTEIAYKIYDNYDERVSFSDSPYLPNVRTDVLKYLQQSDFYIPRFELDYIWSPKKEVYAKIGGGILESMYAGVGGEILYTPFKENYAIGAEIYKVKQREFDQRFKFRDYETETGHINFYYYLDSLDVIAQASFGRYLARDSGWTFDFSRRTKSGFRAGIYFSLTSASSEEFGEGSFDKGFYIQIPFDLLQKKYTSSNGNFRLSPLTRDGGAKLNQGKKLDGFIFDSRFNDLVRSRYDLND